MATGVLKKRCGKRMPQPKPDKGTPTAASEAQSTRDVKPFAMLSASMFGIIIAVCTCFVAGPSIATGIATSIVVQYYADMSAVIAQPRQHIDDA